MRPEQAAVVILGGDGRADALRRAYEASPQVGELIVIPGNDFMLKHSLKPTRTYPNVKTIDVAEIVRICKEEQERHFVLVDVDQDNAVASGLANETRDAGIATIGPSREAGRIEWDKAWARDFMTRIGIPQPAYTVFNSIESGIDYVTHQKERPYAVKATGLAEGKAVILTKTRDEAIVAINQLQRFGSAAREFVIEEYLRNDDGSEGEEFSAFAYCDGENWQLVGYAQDHKRAFDGDVGENTGGMGCSSPPGIVDAHIDAQTREIFSKIFEGLRQEQIPYQGVLYFGGMVVKRNGNPTVYNVECNARYGDPEAEVIVPGITTDFFDLSMATVEGKLDEIDIHTDGKTRVSIAIASQGYPGDYSKVIGRKINGLEQAQRIPGITLFGAGLRQEGEDFFVDKGRIVHLVAEASNIMKANQVANEAADLIQVKERVEKTLYTIGET